MKKVYTAVVVLLFAMSSFAQSIETSFSKAMMNQVSSTETDFISYVVPGQVTSTIDATNHTIKVVMKKGSDLTNLKPNFDLSVGATAYIGTVQQVSGTIVDLSSPVNYKVVAEDGTTKQKWTVTAKLVVDDAIASVKKLDVNVYPNPASNYIVVENAESATVSIYNVVGRLVKTVQSTDSELTIDLSNLTRGTYLINIQKGNQMVTKKVSIIK
jgi:hypothetical protein